MGQLIGTMGATGVGNGNPHLHLQLYVSHDSRFISGENELSYTLDSVEHMGGKDCQPY